MSKKSRQSQYGSVEDSSAEANVSIVNQQIQSTDHCSEMTASQPNGDMKNDGSRVIRSVQFLFLFVFVVFLLVRCVLLVSRFVATSIVAPSCHNLSDYNYQSTYENWMVTFYYSVLEVMRFAEYLVIGINLCIYRYTLDKDNAVTVSDVKWKILKFLPFCLLPMVMAVFIVIFQIQMEDDQEQVESHFEVCQAYVDVSKIYFAYCALNFGRYFFAFSIRLMMVTNTIRITKVWHNSYERLSKYVADCRDGNVKKVAREIHSELTMEYDDCGATVQELFKPFKPWFLIPWIAYAYETSLSALSVLSPWDEGRGKFSVWVKLYALFYSVIEFCLLLLQYLCALRINESHRDYCRKTRMLQMKRLNNKIINDNILEIDYRAFARQLHVDIQDDYNFSPEVWGVHRNISMDTPLYAILLLLNAFVSLSQSFFASNTRIYIL